ncbi:MCE family protein [Gordonia sp. TBRC 11910]|uniref:MCE family protein n=1 Tax=Gordonia asplenii TaxID=2725283 RepID=A0A848L161_9ACTN|nr:MCE family protein [Gordonia asplenii]NMO04202.1 MCE family protein [Gordonia asplenii]
MNIDTTGRNPSMLQYVLRGAAFLVALILIGVLLVMRYEGVFTTVTKVTAQLNDVGDGLIADADVRYNGLIVGAVKSISTSDQTSSTGTRLKNVAMELNPDQAAGIPSNVTARTVPSNLFGVNSVELIQPANPQSSRLADGAVVPADQTQETLALQDVQNQLRDLFRAVPPEKLASVLGTLADALRGGGTTFKTFSGVLNTYFEQINAQFPAGAPSGFDNFNNSVLGLTRSTPQLLNALGRSVIPAMTVAEKQADLAALLQAAQGTLDETQALFAANGDSGKRLIHDLNLTVGSAVYEPNSLPDALVALNRLAARVLTVFTGTNGHVQLNLGINFGAYMRYTRQNCPVYNGGPYGQLRGPGCVGPGTGTGPTSSGPLQIYPSDGLQRRTVGAVTTTNDNKTLQSALGRKPGAADTLMLGPLVQSVKVKPKQGGGR